MNSERRSRRQKQLYGIIGRNTEKWLQRKNLLCFASHAILHPMRRLTAGDHVAYADAVIIKQPFVSSEIIIKLTLKHKGQTRLRPKIRRKIAKLRQSCDRFCVHNLYETTFVFTIATDNFCLHYCN